MLSVVVGTYNRIVLLRQCLDALFASAPDTWQVVVVDGGSTDGSRAYLRRQARVSLICDGELLGQARSLNRVFRTVSTPYTCWLSDDNVLQAGALEAAVGILEQNPQIGLVALKVKDMAGAYAQAAYVGGIWATGALTCNQGVIRTALLKDLGYFDEAFGDYGIDADLTVRVLLAGCQVVHTKAVAIHHYRDYAGAPGVMRGPERARRYQAAVQLYARKYSALIKRRPREWAVLQGGRAAWRALLALRRAAGKDGQSAHSSERYRDWYNVLHGRFISKLDLWQHRRQAFYLVQSIR